MILLADWVRILCTKVFNLILIYIYTLCIFMYLYVSLCIFMYLYVSLCIFMYLYVSLRLYLHVLYDIPVLSCEVGLG